MIRPFASTVVASLLAFAPALVPARAEDPVPAAQATEELPPEAIAFRKLVESIEWKTDGNGDLGNHATINVPTGYRFTGKEGTKKMMETFGNLVSGAELGYLSPLGMDWFAVFEFDDCGYVKDDEKDSLDADKILKQMREGQEKANKELTKRGLDTLEITGWKLPPFYNPQTNNLEWALRLRNAKGGETVNYRTKLLGREGVMDVVLVCDESQLDAVIPVYQDLLKGYAFKTGQSYQEYRKGQRCPE